VSARAGVFWGSVAGAAWVLVGYPAALALRRAPAAPAPAPDPLPSLSVVVPAFARPEALRAKLQALHATDYPPERLEVVVAADEDPQLVRAALGAWPGAEVAWSAKRRGKARAVNEAVALAHGDVVVLTDDNNVLAPGALRAAAAHFADPAVWAVGGRRGEDGSAYDRYEDLLRRLETRRGSVAALSGEFIAVRRAQLPPLPDDVVNDDLWLLCHLVRAGGRVVYEPAASSHEGAIGARDELERRTRIAAGRTLLARELCGLPPGFTLRLLSHKAGRLALPFLLAGVAASSLALARRPGYRAAALTQAAAYGLGAAALAGHPPPGQLLLGNLAAARGVLRGLRRAQPVHWTAVR
jgi:biofilm PGA synthesis N-glycosyltransferase PgaC